MTRSLQFDILRRPEPAPKAAPPDPEPKRCDAPGCNAYACFGYEPRLTKRELTIWRCQEHKLPEDVKERA